MSIFIVLHTIIHLKQKIHDRGFTPIIWSKVSNLRTQCDFPYKRHVKNEFYGECSNNNFNSETRTTSNICKNHNKDPIVKLGSFGHNSLKYCAYISSLRPCAIILMRVTSNCPNPNIILLQTCNLGSATFAWSILSWIMHRNSSFDRINYVLQMWYKFLHNFWCKICFLNFPSYSISSLLFIPTFDIKSLRDSQIVHLAKTDPCFHTLTFQWCLFLNLFMVTTSTYLICTTCMYTLKDQQSGTKLFHKCLHLE